MDTIERLDAFPIKAKGGRPLDCSIRHDFTNNDGNLYNLEKERERRLDNRANLFISDTKTRFNIVSQGDEARKELFVKLAQELGFGDMVGEEAARAAAREKMRTRRAEMSPEQADKERVSAREMMRARREEMSPEQAAEERAKARERMREKRAQMPSDRAAEERAKARERMREKRAASRNP